MTATVDDTFESEVRAMLARRAADIAELPAGSVPPLPSGLRIPLDPPGRDRRRAVLLAAAVVVLLLGAVGVVAVTRGGGTREHTGPADAPTRPTDAPPIDGLPQGITGEDLLPLWTDPPGPDRYAKEDGDLSNGSLAFQRYLQVRFPDGMGSSSRNGEVDGFPDWYRTTFRLQAGEGSGESDEGTAHLWWSGESWSVMAVVSSVVSLGELVVDREMAVGSIYGDGPPWVAAIGPVVPDRRIDSWPEGTTVVGDSSGGDVAIVVDESLPDGPVSLIVAPLVIETDTPPAFSEIAFDTDDLAAPGPTTVPTIPDWGIPGDDVEVVGVPVDAPLGIAVLSALPADEELVAAQHRFDGGRLDIIELSSVVHGSGYEVSIFPRFTGEEYETPWVEVPWGRYRGGGTEGQTSVTAESTDGVAVRVSSVDRENPASHEFLLALVETLVSDPAVIAVANGADPAG